MQFDPALLVEELTVQPPLYSRAELLDRDSPLPSAPGLYAWFFEQAPRSVPTEECFRRDGATLLYVGIAPSRPTTKKSNLRSRIRQHLRGNASSSTLRLSLGCLLAPELGISLKYIKSRFKLGDDEQRLNAWLDQNAYVCWTEFDEPWLAEGSVIKSLSLPLNLEHNDSHPFAAKLSAVRKNARQRARELAG